MSLPSTTSTYFPRRSSRKSVRVSSMNPACHELLCLLTCSQFPVRFRGSGSGSASVFLLEPEDPPHPAHIIIIKQATVNNDSFFHICPSRFECDSDKQNIDGKVAGKMHGQL